MAGQGSGTYKKPLLDEEGNIIATRYSQGKKEPMVYDTPVMEKAAEVIKKFSGRLPEYANDKEGFARFCEETQNYLDYVNNYNSNPERKGNIIATVDSWAVSMGVTARTIENYEKMRSSEWSNFIGYIKTAITAGKLEAVDHGESDRVGTIFYLKNRHGFKDVTTNVNIDLSSQKAVLTAEELPTLGMNDNQSLPDKGEAIQANFQEIKEPEYISTNKED